MLRLCVAQSQRELAEAAEGAQMKQPSSTCHQASESRTLSLLQVHSLPPPFQKHYLEGDIQASGETLEHLLCLGRSTYTEDPAVEGAALQRQVQNNARLVQSGMVPLFFPDVSSPGLEGSLIPPRPCSSLQMASEQGAPPQPSLAPS